MKNSTAEAWSKREHLSWFMKHLVVLKVKYPLKRWIFTWSPNHYLSLLSWELGGWCGVTSAGADDTLLWVWLCRLTRGDRKALEALLARLTATIWPPNQTKPNQTKHQMASNKWKACMPLPSFPIPHILSHPDLKTFAHVVMTRS